MKVQARHKFIATKKCRKLNKKFIKSVPFNTKDNITNAIKVLIIKSIKTPLKHPCHKSA